MYRTELAMTSPQLPSAANPPSPPPYDPQPSESTIGSAPAEKTLEDRPSTYRRDLDEVNPESEDSPWFQLLPPDDQIEFVRELAAVMNAGDSRAPALRLIAEWRNTAQIYAYPELLAALRSAVIDDVGAVPGPAPEA
jgi:hypothetical protein